jgi:predicted transcriptional regulator
MSESDAGLEDMTARLREIAEELRAEGTSDERAEELAREAAELVGRAGNEIERALRQASSED